MTVGEILAFLLYTLTSCTAMFAGLAIIVLGPRRGWDMIRTLGKSEHLR